MSIQIFKPWMGQREIDAVVETIRSGWIGLGPRTKEFEERFAQYVGVEHAIGVNSGTAALHLALLACGVGPGDEVLVPAITFVSTAHAVEYCGAKPVFVDILPSTLNIDLEDAEAKIGPRTKAILPVHYGGHPCDMDYVFDLAKAYDLYVIEDAAHACGSMYKGKKIGSLQSHFTCLSFHAVKNLATADGGMITCHCPRFDQLLRELRWCGIDKSTWARTKGGQGWHYSVNRLGYKYHMNDIQAAMGLVQLARLDEGNGIRAGIAARYDAAFSDEDWIGLLQVSPKVEKSWHNYVIKVSARDRMHTYLEEKGIETGVHYQALTLQPYYDQPGSCPVAERIWKKLLTLPLHPSLSEDDVNEVIEAVLSFGAEL